MRRRVRVTGKSSSHCTRDDLLILLQVSKSSQGQTPVGDLLCRSLLSEIVVLNTGLSNEPVPRSECLAQSLNSRDQGD